MSEYLRNRAAIAATYAIETRRDGELTTRRLAFGANPCRSAIRQAVRDADGSRHDVARAAICPATALDGYSIATDSGYVISAKVESYPLPWMSTLG